MDGTTVSIEAGRMSCGNVQGCIVAIPPKSTWSDRRRFCETSEFKNAPNLLLVEAELSLKMFGHF